MRTRLVLLAVIWAGFALRLFAEGPSTQWTTSVDTIVSTGDTRYLMEELYAGVSSELIFPLNTLLAGVTFRGDHTGGRRDWGFEASVAVNLLAPFGKMEDFDWWMDPDYPKAAFSYTESDVSMIWLAASAAWKPILASGGWGNLAAVLGYRLQYVYQEANGYIGWVYADLTDADPAPPDTPDGQPELYSQYGTGVVLTYWVLWNVPTAGLSITLRPVAGVTVKAEAGVAVPYVADEDDHVLRYKLSTASGLGFGGYADLAVRYSWGKAQSRIRPFLVFSGAALGLKANTQQTQTYYTGATEELPGTSYYGVDHQISTRQLAVLVGGGIEY